MTPPLFLGSETPSVFCLFFGMNIALIKTLGLGHGRWRPPGSEPSTKKGVDQSADRLCNVDSVSELSEETVARLECVLSQERSQESFRLRHREQSFDRGEFATA
jgi:hypothetical protein